MLSRSLLQCIIANSRHRNFIGWFIFILDPLSIQKEANASDTSGPYQRIGSDNQTGSRVQVDFRTFEQVAQIIVFSHFGKSEACDGRKSRVVIDDIKMSVYASLAAPLPLFSVKATAVRV